MTRLTELDLWRLSLPADLRSPDLRLETACVIARIRVARMDLQAVVAANEAARESILRLPPEVLRAAAGRE